MSREDERETQIIRGDEAGMARPQLPVASCSIGRWSVFDGNPSTAGQEGRPFRPRRIMSKAWSKTRFGSEGREDQTTQRKPRK